MTNNEVLPLVTVSGPPGSGTSTLVDGLAREMNFEPLSGGDIFRQMAADRGLDLAEITELAEEDDSIDRELDRRLKDAIDAHLAGDRAPDGERLAVDSRLAGWHANGRATLAVWLDAPLEVRVERISGRSESADELREREQSEAERYETYYDIDIDDLTIYDIVVWTDTLSEIGTLDTVQSALEDVC